MKPRPAIAFVVAHDRDRLIGRDGGLPWRLPDDMRWFREQTLGKPVVMGRKTYESLPPRFRPLPDRHNIILTRDPAYRAPGATVVHSVEEALAAAGDVDEIIIAGGAEIYRLFLPWVDRLYLTEVDAAADVHADDAPGREEVYLPPIPPGDWQEVYRVHHPADDRHAHAFTWRILERTSAAGQP